MSADAYKHPKWQQTRLRIMERDGWKCLACEDAESTLHVHHMYYDGDPWNVSDEYLQTLCEHCHARLGPHPKAGVYWGHQKQSDRWVIAVCWCTQCGCMTFKDKGNYFKCRDCGWNTSEIDAEITLGAKVEVIEEQSKKKPREYSLSWLKGMMTKVRNGGATDLQIFDAIFPDHPASQAVAQFRQLAKNLADALKRGDISAQDECRAIELIVGVRRKIQTLLACSAEAPLDKEATDGTQAG